MSYDPNIDNRKSIRLKNYDYGQPADYFITICAKNRKHYFGEIKDYKVQLSKIGKLVFEEWNNTENIRKNVKLGPFIIMPNHIHGIISIVDPNNEQGLVQPIPTNEILDPKPFHKFGSQSNNLFSIIGGFKGTITKQLSGNSIWQSRFYDHIIRSDESYNKISDYITGNPFNWQTDIENEEFNRIISENQRKQYYQKLFLTEKTVHLK